MMNEVFERVGWRVIFREKRTRNEYLEYVRVGKFLVLKDLSMSKEMKQDIFVVRKFTRNGGVAYCFRNGWRYVV